jgi:hypothetical protein
MNFTGYFNTGRGGVKIFPDRKKNPGTAPGLELYGQGDLNLSAVGSVLNLQPP